MKTKKYRCICGDKMHLLSALYLDDFKTYHGNAFCGNRENCGINVSLSGDNADDIDNAIEATLLRIGCEEITK